MRDIDANGKVDRVIATFSETLAASTDTAPWTLTNVPSAGTLASVSTSGATATLVISEGAGARTPPSAPSGSSSPPAPPASATPPATSPPSPRPPPPTRRPRSSSACSCRTRTPTARSTTSVATFSESLAAYSAGTAPWTLANVPSGGTPRLRHRLRRRRHAHDHRRRRRPRHRRRLLHGRPRHQRHRIRDAAGNLSSFAATAPADGAKPVLVAGTLAMRDIDANGKVDRVVATFSETLAASTDTTPWTLTNVPSAGTLASVSTVGRDRHPRHQRGRGSPEHRCRHLPGRPRGQRHRHPRRRRQPVLLRLDRPRRPGDPDPRQPAHAGHEHERQGRPRRCHLLGGALRLQRRHRPLDARERPLGRHARLRHRRRRRRHAHDHRRRRRPRHRRRLLHGRPRHQRHRHPRRRRQPLLLRRHLPRRRRQAGPRRRHPRDARHRRKRQGRPRRRHLLARRSPPPRTPPPGRSPTSRAPAPWPRSPPRARPRPSSSARARAPRTPLSAPSGSSSRPAPPASATPPATSPPSPRPPPPTRRPRFSSACSCRTRTQRQGRPRLATFSESLAAYSAGTAPWTLANVPSGGTLASVTVSARSPRSRSPKARAPPTPPWLLHRRSATNATGIRDAAGNLSSFAATLTRRRGEAGTGQRDFDEQRRYGRSDGGGRHVRGDVQRDDCDRGWPSTTITETDPSGAGNDRLTVAGLTRRRGGCHGIEPLHRHGQYERGVLLEHDEQGRRSRHRDGCGPCSGTCGRTSPPASARWCSRRIQPLQDAAGNAAAGSVTTLATFRLF